MTTIYFGLLLLGVVLGLIMFGAYPLSHGQTWFLGTFVGYVIGAAIRNMESE